jgi:hypothetical protein
MPPKIVRPKIKHTSGDVADCADDITPDCLRALYGIPTLNPATRLNVSFYLFLVIILSQRINGNLTSTGELKTKF